MPLCLLQKHLQLASTHAYLRYLAERSPRLFPSAGAAAPSSSEARRCGYARTYSTFERAPCLPLLMTLQEADSVPSGCAGRLSTWGPPSGNRRRRGTERPGPAAGNRPGVDGRQTAATSGAVVCGSGPGKSGSVGMREMS